MDTLTILFVLPLVIICSYLFDALARKTKFPSVILLMSSGLIIRAITSAYGFTDTAFLKELIPVLGTIGLILIVLEGALELDIKKEKIGVIIKGFLSALVILLVNIAVLSWGFEALLGMDFYTAIIYAIPLSIISSAVAIPSAANLLQQDKEFVVYESTFSDILGIMAFNYAIVQAESGTPLLGVKPLVTLLLQIGGVVLVSLCITFVLFRLLQQIGHHVKFFLILALLILVYAIGKYYHLPALVTIFIFGLFLSNVKSLLPAFMKNKLDLEQTKQGLHEFHLLTAESTFIVRTFFFLFFGFSIVITDFSSVMPFVYGIVIFVAMFVIRYLYLSISRFNFIPSTLLYLSPRGLISILLFLQIGKLRFIENYNIPIDEPTLLVVILCSLIAMIFGTVKAPQAENTLSDVSQEVEPSLTETPFSFDGEAAPIDESEFDGPNTNPPKETEN